MLHRLKSLGKKLLSRSSFEREIDEELRCHIEERADDLVRGGMDRTAALRQARLEFGALEAYRQECRESPGIVWVESLWMDVRFSLRQLSKSRSFTAIAVGSLAIAIGANAAIFGLVNAVILQDLPYRDPDRVVAITERQVDQPARWLIPRIASFDALKRMTQSEDSAFDSVTTLEPDGRPLPMTDPSGPENLSPGALAADTLSFLGVQPMLGRTFDPEEIQTAASQRVILSHRFWDRRFGSDPGIVGRTIELNRQPATIVGILGPRFIVPGSDRVDIWLPQRIDRTGRHGTSVLARLKPDIPLERAQQELDSLSQRLAEALPETHQNLHLVAEPAYNLIYQGSDRNLYALWGAAAVILLIACLNVAGLVLARVSARQREIASRLALGSSHGRLARLLLTESTMLAVGGAFAGILLAYWSIGGLASLGPLAGIPRINEAEVNIEVLAYTTLVCLLTGLFCGLGPTLWAAKQKPGALLKPTSGGVERQGARSAVIVAQVALSMVLVAAAGLTTHSFLKLQTLETGYELDNLLTFQIWLNEPEEYGKAIDIGGKTAVEISPRLDAFFQEILRSVRNLPGVSSADAVSHLPLNGYTYFAHIQADHRDVEKPVTFRAISEGYFRTMGIPLLRGRHFDGRDTSGSPWVVIINESMAEDCWPGEDPIGKTVLVQSDWQPVYGERPREVVGVVADIRDDRLWPRPDERKGEMFVPVQQLPQVISWLKTGSWRARMMYTLRTVGKPELLTPSVLEAVARVDPRQPVTMIQPMKTYHSASTRESRSYMFLMAFFALVAVLLVAIGIYGAIAYAVGRRTQEIGIRMALGAMRKDILKIAMSRELARVAIGMALGLMLAFWLTQLVFHEANTAGSDRKLISLYGVGVAEPLTLATVSALLAAVAALASYLPARRAASVHPVDALRHE